jgi:hypothetical protein
LEIRPVHLTAQHGNLLPKRQNLDFLGMVTTAREKQEL